MGYLKIRKVYNWFQRLLVFLNLIIYLDESYTNSVLDQEKRDSVVHIC